LGGLENCFDTVLCLNVLGYLNDPGAVVESLRATAHTEGLAAGDRADRVQFPSDPQSRRTEVTATWVSGRRVFTA